MVSRNSVAMLNLQRQQHLPTRGPQCTRPCGGVPFVGALGGTTPQRPRTKSQHDTFGEGVRRIWSASIVRSSGYRHESHKIFNMCPGISCSKLKNSVEFHDEKLFLTTRNISVFFDFRRENQIREHILTRKRCGRASNDEKYFHHVYM